MLKYSKGESITKKDAEWYSKQFRGLKATTEIITKTYTDMGRTYETNIVVFKGSWTPYGAIRDCGDHYIEALYSSYRWISKDFQTIIEDVEDR